MEWCSQIDRYNVAAAKHPQGDPSPAGDDPVAARAALFDATSRKWPRTAGFGPNYMWHVARLQFDELTKIDE